MRHVCQLADDADVGATAVGGGDDFVIGGSRAGGGGGFTTEGKRGDEMPASLHSSSGSGAETHASGDLGLVATRRQHINPALKRLTEAPACQSIGRSIPFQSFSE